MPVELTLTRSVWPVTRSHERVDAIVGVSTRLVVARERDDAPVRDRRVPRDVIAVHAVRVDAHERRRAADAVAHEDVRREVRVVGARFVARLENATKRPSNETEGSKADVALDAGQSTLMISVVLCARTSIAKAIRPRTHQRDRPSVKVRQLDVTLREHMEPPVIPAARSRAIRLKTTRARRIRPRAAIRRSSHGKGSFAASNALTTIEHCS